MWTIILRTILFTGLILLARPLFALPSDDEVAQWTGHVLYITLAADYKGLENKTQRNQYNKYYSGQAVTGISNFFTELLPIMIENKLSTNPVPLGPPEIKGRGKMNGLNYWEVSQAFNLTSLNRKVLFLVIVIENSDPPLLIQSLNMEFYN